ncbi:MAG: 16S rRNA pseudouridine(516) synthase [Proteobacteria bacterium]|nr:16S rRNA pseudouridine(516) synthase [Pseudomonadota bacterium]
MTRKKRPTLAQVLFSQGFGTRRECESLVAAGFVSLAGEVCDDPWHEVDPEGLEFGVQGQRWPYREKALVMLHKPAGYECSQKPKHHPSVLSLLPAPLRTRGVQPVGRLDEDTTGLLLLTDDGALIHRLTSPRHHVPKVYEVHCKHAVDAAQLAALRAGVVLDDDPAPVRAAACEADGTHGLRLTLTEGKYHQVKRMVAAAGNRVEALHRSAFGALVLPADLAPGQWRWVEGPQALVPPQPPR